MGNQSLEVDQRREVGDPDRVVQEQRADCRVAPLAAVVGAQPGQGAVDEDGRGQFLAAGPGAAAQINALNACLVEWYARGNRWDWPFF